MAIGIGTRRADIFRVSGNADRFLGFDGDDLFLAVAPLRPSQGSALGRGIDVFVGGGGIDTVSYGHATANITVDLGRTTAQQTGAGGFDRLIGIENVIGGHGSDWVLGDDANNRLSGENNQDRVEGGRGNDRLFGGSGDDYLVGGAGNDYVHGGAGHDIASYLKAPRAIVLQLADGIARDTGGAGIDRLFNIEQVDGSQWNDRITGDGRDNLLRGMDGDDLLAGGEGHDRLAGGAGRDTLSGQLGNDTLIGHAGDDRLFGGVGADILAGGAGVDTHVYAAGANGAFDIVAVATNVTSVDLAVDSIEGFTSEDRLSFDAASYGFAVSPVAEGVNFSVIDTTFDGTFAGLNADFLDGRGAFVFSTLDSRLNFDANGAADGYFIVARIDTVSVHESLLSNILPHWWAGSGAGSVTVNVTIPDQPISAGQIEVIGATARATNPAPSTVGTGGGADNPSAPPPADQTPIGGGNDEPVEGGEDRDDSLVGGTGNDWLSGEAGNDVIEGGDGDDRLLGGHGDDTLLGGQGNDVVDGGSGSGNDTLDGDDYIARARGHDIMTGGAGNDEFNMYEWATLKVGESFGLNVTRAAAGITISTITDFETGDVVSFDINQIGAWPGVFDHSPTFGAGSELVDTENCMRGFVNAEDGINFSTIDEVFDGTNAGSNASFSAGIQTFIFSTADNTLYFDSNGSDPGYSAVVEVLTDTSITAGAVRVNGIVPLG